MIKINDILGYDNLYVFQDPEYFCFSLDSVILANYVNIRLRDDKIIDFCTGNAVVPIILSKRCNKNIDALEIQDKIFSLAKKSVDYNNLNDRINLYKLDVKVFAMKEENMNKYDLVLCNPPYFKNDINSTKNVCHEKMLARHEILININDVCRCAQRILKDNGSLCIVHRTDRLMEILKIFNDYNISPKRIKFIHKNQDSQSTLVLIQGQKNGKVGLMVEKPLIMYDKNGLMTEEYKKLQTEVIK